MQEQGIPPLPPGLRLVSGGSAPPAPRPAPVRQAAPRQASSQPRGLRNNNPGNIEDGDFARSLPGYAGSDGRFARFDNADAGAQAAPRLLKSYLDRGFDTPAEIINRWAPPSDNNPTMQYASYVAQRAGVGLNDPVTPDHIPLIAQAISEFENGQTQGGAAPQAQAQAAVPPLPPGLTMVSDSVQPAAAPPSSTGFNLPEGVVDWDLLSNQERQGLQRGARVLMPQNEGETFRQIVTLAGDAGGPQRNTLPGDDVQMFGGVRGVVPGMADVVGAVASGAAEQIPGLDEAVTGLDALVNRRSFSESRDQYRDTVTALNDQQRGARNVGGVLGFGAGLVAPGAGFLKGSTGLLNASLRGAALGTGYGALYGATGADGGLADRGAGAVGGAVAGGLLGGATPAAVNIGRSVVQRGASGFAEAGARVQRGLGIQPGEANITPRTTESALDFIQRIASGGGRSLDGNEIAAMGKPITAAEALGPNGVSQMTALTRRSGRTAGLAEDALGARAADQPTRILQDFADLTGADPAGSADIISNLAATGRTRAAPLYEAAYARPGAVRSPLIDSLMDRPSVRSAFNRAANIAKEEGRDPTTLGFQFDEAGDVVHVREPSMQTLDYIKRGLDDGLETYRDSTTRRLNLNTQGRADLGTATAFRNELVRLNPAYGEALQAGGDPIRLEEAFNQAGRLFGTGINERAFAQRIAGMGEAGRGAMIAGLADDLFTKARNGRLRPNQLTVPAFEGKLAQLLGPEQARSFIARLQAEVVMSRGGGRMAPGTNSTTGEVVEAMRDQDRGVGFGADLSRNIEQSGAVGGLLRTGADMFAAPIAGFVRGAQAPAPQGVRDEIGRLLLMPPEELQSLLANRPRPRLMGLGVPPALAGQSGGLLAQ